jgi:hypothetical protein
MVGREESDLAAFLRWGFEFEITVVSPTTVYNRLALSFKKPLPQEVADAYSSNYIKYLSEETGPKVPNFLPESTLKPKIDKKAWVVYHLLLSTR